MSLVERAAPRVALEREELQALRRELLGLVEQRAADPDPLRLRVDEQLAHYPVRQRQQADDRAIALGYPDLLVLHQHVAKEAQVLLVRVTHALFDVGLRVPARALPHRDRLLHVAGPDLADLHVAHPREHDRAPPGAQALR